MSFIKNQKGNVVVIILVVLVVAAVGGLAYMSGKMEKPSSESEVASAQTSGTAAEAQVAAAPETDKTEAAATQETAEQAEEVEIKPGNPVVAKINGAEINRLDVFGAIQSMPPQARQMPIDKLFPLALDQVVNAKLIDAKTENVKLDNDPEVKKQLAESKKQIVKTVYIQNMISKKIDDEKVEAAYAEIVKNTPDVEEVKASHILVEDEATAKEVLTKLIETGDFETLAKEYSKDSTAENGGALGYFTKTDVVKEFGESAFAMEPGIYTKEPVKTEFGYHIIRVEDKRKRQPPTLEQAKPFIEGNLRQQALSEIVEEWKAAANIERFDINGEAIKAEEAVQPSAGE